MIEEGLITRPADEQLIYDEARAHMFHVLGAENGNHGDNAVTQRRRYDGPVRIASFEC